MRHFWGNLVSPGVLFGRIRRYIFMASRFMEVYDISHFRINNALSLNGLNAYVALPTIQQMNIIWSFTVSAWIELPVDYPLTQLPIICTLDRTLCLSINNGWVTNIFGEPDPRHYQMSMMEFFCQGSEWLKTINYFSKRATS